MVKQGFYEVEGTFIHAHNHDLEGRLKSNVYKINEDDFGRLIFSPKEFKTDEILDLNSETEVKVLNEIELFLQSKEKFERYGLIHKRGVLLHGEPGNGKTSLINRLTGMFLSKGLYVIDFNGSSFSSIVDALGVINACAPGVAILVIIEDIDSLMSFETILLSLFDGQNQHENIVYLATTNYIDRLSPRLLRPSRFDIKIEVPKPSHDSRKIYIKSKLLGDDLRLTDALTEKTEGLSMADIKEVIICVTCLNYTIDDAVAQVKSNPTSTQSTSSDDFFDQLINAAKMGKSKSRLTSSKSR